jgi:hypothetical protein
MDTTSIIEEIDGEIARLEEARTLLTGSPTKANPAQKQGRGGVSGGGKRTMSAAGRARIAAAQKARWAKAKKAGK